MNKIFFLKALIGFLSFLIFMTLLGIIYGIINYDTTPKLFSQKKKISSPVKNKTVQDVFLKRPEAQIVSSFGCGDSLCLQLKEKGKDFIAVIPVQTPKNLYFVSIGSDSSSNRKETD